MLVDQLSGIYIAVRTKSVPAKDDLTKVRTFRTMILAQDGYPVSVSIPESLDISKIKVGETVKLQNVSVLPRSFAGQVVLNCYITE